MGQLFQDLRSASRQQAVVRAAIVLASLVFAACLVLAGESLPFSLVVLSLLGVLCVLNPHTQMPVALMLYMLIVWAAGVPSVWHPLTLPAALCLLVIHVASALAAGVPAQAALPPGLWRLYRPRLLLVCAATTVVWVLAAGASTAALPGGVVAALTGLGVVTIGVVTHYLRVTRPVVQWEPREKPSPVLDARPGTGRRPTGFGMS